MSLKINPSIYTGNQCNETRVRFCYHQFDDNSSHICSEVMRLKLCLKRLFGCHEMRHPSFAGAKKILDDHGGCFVNYTKVLGSQKTKANIQRFDKTTKSKSTQFCCHHSTFLRHICACLNTRMVQLFFLPVLTHEVECSVFMYFLLLVSLYSL